MPAGLNTPSLAESWSMSRDGLSYEFVIRKGATFHNGDPVTAEDVKFSFERYKGAWAKRYGEKAAAVEPSMPSACASGSGDVDIAFNLRGTARRGGKALAQV